MPSDAIAGLISLLAASLTAMCVLFVGVIARRRAWRSVSGRDLVSNSWERRIAPMLDLIPLPKGIKRQWGSDEVMESLAQAGLPWNAHQFAGFRWAALWLALSAATTMSLASGWTLVVVFVDLSLLIAVAAGPMILVRRRVERRCAEIEESLPGWLDRLTMCMEAGLGFEVALRRTGSQLPGLLGEEVGRLIRAMDHGRPRAQALDDLSEKLPSTDLAAFVSAVKQSDRLGTSLARTLRTQCQLLRARRRRRAEEAGQRLPVLIVFPLVLCFLPALLIIYLAPPLLHLFLGR